MAIDPSWQMLEEIEFHRLAKLRLEVDEPEEMYLLPFGPPRFELTSLPVNHTAVFILIIRHMIALPPKQSVHFNLLTELNITQLHPMTRSFNRYTSPWSNYLSLCFFLSQACIQGHCGDLCDGYHP